MKKVVLFLLIAFIIAYVIWPFSFDRFAGHDLAIQSDRTCYEFEQKVALTATVTPDSQTRIRLYKDRTKSFRLIVRRATADGKADKNDNDFYSSRNETESTIEEIAISPESPFHLYIPGRLLRNSAGEIKFDFGPFGVFSKSSGEKFLVLGFWKPIKPNPLDSLEDFTNTLTIKVADKCS